MEVAKSRPTWDEYFLTVAHAIAERSTCLRARYGVGCVIASSKHTILGTGYAGSVRGQPHCIDPGVGCLIDELSGGCVRTVHAEQNAILHAGGHCEGATAYCTLSPCWVCMRLLVQAGVQRVVYAVEYRLGVGLQRTLADGAGVVLEHVPSRGNERAVQQPEQPIVCDRCGYALTTVRGSNRCLNPDCP